MHLAVFEGSDERLSLAHGVRRVVFIDEQSVPEEEEIDGRDAECVHVLLSVEGRTEGTARLRWVEGGTVAKVERVAVHRRGRGRGWGARIMGVLHGLAARTGTDELRLGAQLTALGFYERLGYTAFGPVFDDAGIDHRMMRRAVAVEEGAALEDAAVEVAPGVRSRWVRSAGPPLRTHDD